MSSLSTLRTKFNSEVKINKNNKIWSTSTVDQYINAAVVQIQKDNGFSWRENSASDSTSATSGTAEYSLPSDFIRMDLVRFNLQPLKQTSKKDIQMTQQTSASGTPAAYYINGTVYGLHPTPTAGETINLDYFKRLPTITTSQDSSFPEDFDDATIKYAAYLAFSTYRPKYADSEQRLRDYRIAINTLLSAYGLYDTADMTFRYQRTSGFYSGGYVGDTYY